MEKKSLPIGISSFEKMIHGNGTVIPYYVDKTMMIHEIIAKNAEVNLIPRPRRFGKSLNLDMMCQFLSIGADQSLFDGLEISRHADFCRTHQGQYPVLFLDLKEVEGDCFEDACAMMEGVLYDAAQSMSYLSTSPALIELPRLAPRWGLRRGF